MAPHFQFDEQNHEVARIKILGVGGGGGNAVNYMIEKGLSAVEYISLNTDRQALTRNRADLKIQVGTTLTGGLGAGARPEIGREAVEESRGQIEQALEGADMAFITAGMGGGTGTGGAPVVAGIARRKGILTVGIVTTPFQFEGKVRMQYALEGINEMRMNCDTLIVIPNERLLELSDETTSLVSAFATANDVLYNATKGISDLVILPGLINLDFADVRTTMTNGGAAIMGSAAATGPDRAEVAAMEAINSPLLDGVSIRGARNVLVNISSDESLGMHETGMATKIIQQEAGDDAEIIIGTVLDASNGENMRVTVIATGFELEQGSAQIRLAAQNGAAGTGQPGAMAAGRAGGAMSPGATGYSTPGAGMGGPGVRTGGAGAGRLSGLSGGPLRPAGPMGGGAQPGSATAGQPAPGGLHSPYSGGMRTIGGPGAAAGSTGSAPHDSAHGAPRGVQGPHTDPLQMDEPLESQSNDYYRGERNLKQLDTPAIQRRQILHGASQPYADEDHRVMEQSDSTPGQGPASRDGMGHGSGAPAEDSRGGTEAGSRMSLVPGASGSSGIWARPVEDSVPSNPSQDTPSWSQPAGSPDVQRAGRDEHHGGEGRPLGWQEKQKIDKSDPNQPAFLRRIMD